MTYLPVRFPVPQDKGNVGSGKEQQTCRLAGVIAWENRCPVSSRETNYDQTARCTLTNQGSPFSLFLVLPIRLGLLPWNATTIRAKETVCLSSLYKIGKECVLNGIFPYRIVSILAIRWRKCFSCFHFLIGFNFLKLLLCYWTALIAYIMICTSATR